MHAPESEAAPVGEAEAFPVHSARKAQDDADRAALDKGPRGKALRGFLRPPLPGLRARLERERQPHRPPLRPEGRRHLQVHAGADPADRRLNQRPPTQNPRRPLRRGKGQTLLRGKRRMKIISPLYHLRAFALASQAPHPESRLRLMRTPARAILTCVQTQRPPSRQTRRSGTHPR